MENGPVPKIVPHIPPGMPMHYANFVTVQTLGDEFFVTLFQGVQPYALSAEELAAQTQDATIDVHCVSRLVLTRAAARAMAEGVIELLNKQGT